MSTKPLLSFLAGILSTVAVGAVAQLSDGATVSQVKVVDFSTRQELTQCYAAVFLLDGHAIMCMRPSRHMDMRFPLPPQRLAPLPDPTRR
jgi:hypothetical protein